MTTLPTITQDGVIIVYIRDLRLTEETRIEGIGEDLIQLIDRTAENKILISFRNVKFMGSAMIGKLIQLNKKCNESDVDLRFCEMNENLMDVFKLMKLNKVLKIHETEEEALDVFQKRKRSWHK